MAGRGRPRTSPLKRPKEVPEVEVLKAKREQKWIKFLGFWTLALEAWKAKEARATPDTIPDIKEVGEDTLKRMEAVGVIDSEVHKALNDYFTWVHTKGKKTTSGKGFRERVMHTTGFVAWLYEHRIRAPGGTPAKGPVRMTDLGGPPTKARPELKGFVNEATALRFYSDLEGEEQVTIDPAVGALIKKLVMGLESGDYWPPNTVNAVRDLRTTKEKPVSTMGYPLSYQDVNIFFNNLLFGMKPYQRYYAKYLLQTGLRPKHAYMSLRFWDLEAATAAIDITAAPCHRLEIRNAIDTAREHQKGIEVSRIKGYPDSVVISRDLYDDLMAFMTAKGSRHPIRLWDTVKRSFSYTWKTVAEMTEVEKKHCWVFGHMAGDRVLASDIVERKKFPLKYQLPPDPRNRFVLYSLRKTWATVIYRLTEKDVNLVMRMGGWASVEMPLTTYIEAMPETDAWFVKSKYGIYIPSGVIPATRLLDLQYNSADAMVKESVQDLMEAILERGLPESALYVMLREAGVPVGEAPEVVAKAAEELRLKRGKAWAVLPRERIMEEMKKGEKSEALAERLKALEREAALVREACKEAAVSGVGEAEKEYRGLPKKEKELVTPIDVYESMKKRLQAEIDRSLGVMK